MCMFDGGGSNEPTPKTPAKTQATVKQSEQAKFNTNVNAQPNSGAARRKPSTLLTGTSTLDTTGKKTLLGA